jgi:hypothetical protein
VPRISTACLHCPPDAPEGRYCGWEFTLNGDQEANVVDELQSPEKAGD